MIASYEGTAERQVREWEQLKALRGTWESHWREIAERVLPMYREFNMKETKGSKRTDMIYDSTAPMALNTFAAALESLLTPRAQRWHGLKSTLPELNEDHDTKLWFDEVTRLLFAYRYAPKANFASQYHENYIQLGAFGTGSVFVDENIDGGLRYRSVHLNDMYIAENHQGVIDTVYRRLTLTARQATQREDWKEKLPRQIVEANNPFTEFEFLHCVKPREDYDPNRADFKGMEFVSYYISITGKVLLSEGGYSTFPYPVSRYMTAPNEVYGRSPAMLALPDIKMLNEMSKTDIRASHKLVDPPLLLHDDSVMGGGSMNVRTTPGALIYGGVNADGRQLIQPLVTGARVDIADTKMDQRREAINESFLVKVFQILVDNPQMTATEALMRAQEKGALLGPAMGRQQSESLGRTIEREIDILMRQGKLPPMTEAMIEAGGEYEIQYESPLNRMQRSEEVIGITRTIEVITPLAQIDPTIFNVFDGPEVARLTAEINGVPAKVMRSREDAEALTEQQQEAAANDQALQQAQPAATAMKDAAQAQALLREPV